MESPAPKRSIFGFSGLGLWRSSTAPPADTNGTAPSAKPSGVSLLPPRVESGNASAPESPAKRASDTQLASRKILHRPQGPSSKLSQSVSATDFDRSSSAAPNMMPSTTSSGFLPRRKPGDNPYKSSAYSSSTIANPPPVSAYKSNNFSGSSSTPRNIFRTSAIYQRPPLPTFAPRVPHNTLTQSFPPNTPGKAPRGSVADVSGRSMAQTASSELFEMRIPEPPRHLTGEALAKEVPDSASRVGSVYADEFLAHYCPPDLDEHQRRQFFCILDLRRLKYAANEVFVKKDWKINAINFAKEYEKSRSLIMLRYGLYEFKTVRASEAVKKEWREKHGIVSTDDEAESASLVKPSVTSKRKAEDDLQSTDSAMTTGSSNANKRARAPDPPAPAPVKTKRKADAEPEETQPSKLVKSSTPQKAPSATKSVFESIAKKSMSSTTPAKPPAKSNMFAPSAAPKLTNGDSGRSVFDTTAKAPAPASNIFGHLSDASKGSPNDDADAESETSSGEEEESEGQEASASDDASAATNGDKTHATVNGTSSTSSEEATQGRSLFDRVTKGPDGQPVKVTPQQSASPFSASDKEKSVSPPKEVAPSPAPTNNTWNTNSPIKFSAGSNAFLGAPTPIPAASASIDFAAKKPESVPTPQSSFGFPSKAAEPAPKAEDAKASPAPSLFSFGAKPAAATTSFGTPAAATPSFGTPAASTGASLFGSGPSAFGQAKDKEPAKESKPAPAPASNLFGSTTPAPAAAEASKPSVFQSSTLFGSQPKPDATPAPASQTSSLFGKPSSSETPAAAPPSTNLFGANSTQPAFGAGATPAFGFGSTPAPASSGSKPLFGTASSSTPAAEAKPLFGSTPAPSAGNSQSSIFGTTPASQSGAAKPLFGTTLTSQPEASKPLFGSTTPAAPPPSSNMFSFGSTTAPSQSQQSASQPGGTGSIFGGTGAAGGGASFAFSAAGGPTGGNPFAAPGTSSAPVSFNFGSDGGSQPSFTFGATAPAPSISFGGPTQDSNSQPSQGMFGGSSTPSFSFGATASQPNGSAVFSQQPPSNMFNLAPAGGGTSTGTNSPFTFGGASSLATTPAAGTPEPAAPSEENRGTNADGAEEPQEQISLTSGGPGEEDESVVHEIRAKALKLVTATDSDNDDSGSKDNGKSPWRTQGVGPLRVLRHKATGAVRMLLRAEPRGHVALNKLVLPGFSYRCEPAGGKYVKLTTASDDGKGLETWMLQVKTPAAAEALAKVLEDNKKANEKK
ncbi:nucleoporin nup61 [Podospora conica]|nr:nucleoporin nup61 [Schizothecium conicum]